MPKIIHIDDSSFQRRISKKILAEVFQGSECESFSDSETLNLINHNYGFNDIDIVVTDLLMDKIPGQEVIKYVKEKNDSCVIAVLSSNILESEKEKCYKNGADIFIEKPLTKEKTEELKAYYDNRK
jgi:CheY-like chemotaxis protein